MKLYCNQCETLIPAEDINLDRFVAKCVNCDSLFKFSESFEYVDNDKRASKVSRVEKLDAPLPDGVTIQKKGNHLVIQMKWFRLRFIFFAFFALFWNGFMVVWYGIVISFGAWQMGLFGLLHGAVGIGLIYYVIAGFLNKTTISVTPKLLKVTHRPLPYRGQTIKPADIKQLYCKKTIRHNNRSSTVTYELHAITLKGKNKKLLSGLDDYQEALYFEQEIERFLEINDQPVRGEYRP